ncbi:MAG TPA: cytochrome c [Pyrinomonadaceae bacterium]|nr:cytochrome c [Pyrinomonadaceae bacterium]
MKLISLALTCVVLALVVSACTETAAPTNTNTSRTAASPAAPAATATPDPLVAARANFAKNCEGCHGPNGEGGLAKVDNRQIKVPSLKSEHAIKHTDDQIAKMITNGEEEMPPFKDKMSQTEIADLVKFVRKEFQGK